MKCLSTTVSAVNAFSQSMASSYLNIAGEAEQVQQDVNEMQMRVQQAEEDVTEQLYKAEQLHDEAEAKESYYEGMRDQAEREVMDAQAEIDYVLSHPIEITEQDSEGNTYTRYEIDQAALAAAESRYNHAMAEYNFYNRKCAEASALVAEASTAVSRFQNLKHGIEAVNNMIREQVFKISQSNRELNAEAGYNLQCMRKVMDRMEKYLACRPVYFSQKSV